MIEFVDLHMNVGVGCPPARVFQLDSKTTSHQAEVEGIECSENINNFPCFISNIGLFLWMKYIATNSEYF